MGLGGETRLRSCRLPGGQLLISMLTHYRMMNMLLLFIHKECLFFFFNLQLRCNFLPPLKALNCYCPKVLYNSAATSWESRNSMGWKNSPQSSPRPNPPNEQRKQVQSRRQCLAYGQGSTLVSHLTHAPSTATSQTLYLDTKNQFRAVEDFLPKPSSVLANL